MKNLFAVLLIVGLLFCTISCGKSEAEKAADAATAAINDYANALSDATANIGDDYADALKSINDAVDSVKDLGL